MFIRWLKCVYREMRQRKKLQKAGFKFINPKRNCTISLKELCGIFNSTGHYIWLRNAILREAKRKPQKFRYVLLSMDKDRDLCFTVAGLQEFQELFTAHFDAAGFQYLCEALSEIDREHLHSSNVPVIENHKAVRS